MDSLFFEILIAPDFDENALILLQNKKNRIILHQKENQQDIQPKTTFRTLLNGVISQEKDIKNETEKDLTFVTNKKPSQDEIKALLLANKLVKHSKSNAIILANSSQMLASGVGQTSRIDALKHAIEKALAFGMDLKGAVMASDAFFPFPDCVEIAHNVGIVAVIQPGGSIKDKDSIAFCDNNEISMVFTGFRHFKH
jgi:phosphoribosylaminoimidazolecarboxamide formyltransferase/IMP cyclohydrolase